MADSEKQKLSQKERQLEKIEKLKKQLEQEEAKLRSQARKERDGQLIAFGVFMEMGLRITEQKEFEATLEAMKTGLKGKLLERALAGMERIAKERTALASKEEISPEPPSQLPDAEAQEKNQGSA